MDTAMSKSQLLFFSLFFFLLSACNKSADPYYLGYVEGEYIYLAAPISGYLKSLKVTRGTHVDAKTMAFAIDDDLEVQSLDEMKARASSAKERLQNLSESRRPQEIATAEAQLQSAEAALRLSAAQLKSQEALAAKGYVSELGVDAARTAKARDAALVEAARQQLEMFRNALGRDAELGGAKADVLAAQAQVAQKRWQMDNKKVLIPTPGEITETYFQSGEWVPAGQPVASLLPDSKRRIRFFVPETLLSSLGNGQAVEASCDGCATPIVAKISFIAATAEYTPPVIYSQGSREKLVFRVEATPVSAELAHLRPGLPVEVRLK
jgi:HlyD family secretion protein